MADITHAGVVRFANERCRALSDRLTAAVYACKAFQADYLADGIAAAVASNANGDVIIDGSAQDGRQTETKLSLVNFKAGVDHMVTQWAALVAGVGASMETIENGWQVNGSPR